MDDVPCEKCNAPITTGLMAVFCPHKQECAFWVPGVEEFKRDWDVNEGAQE